jgi:hypothetical protein
MLILQPIYYLLMPARFGRIVLAAAAIQSLYDLCKLFYVNFIF